MRIETSFGAEGPDNIANQFLIVNVLFEINIDRVVSYELPNEKIGKCIDEATKAFKEEWATQELMG